MRLFTGALLLPAVLVAAASGPSPAPPSLSTATWRSFWQSREQLWREQEARWRQRLLDRGGGKPQAGAVYTRTLNMPVIGRQTFMLRVLGRQRCQIVLIGPLSLNEPASYVEESTAANGVIRLAMVFNEPTLELLRRWRTRIKGTTWTRDGDFATLVVQPPLIPAIRIRMERVANR